MCPTCVFTVTSAMDRSRAISGLDETVTRRVNTTRSRSVRTSSAAVSGSGGAVLSTASRSRSRCVVLIEAANVPLCTDRIASTSCTAVLSFSRKPTAPARSIRMA